LITGGTIEKKCKITSNGVVKGSRDLRLEFLGPYCFEKPEIVISQPWIEIYQTSANTKHATGIRFATL